MLFAKGFQNAKDDLALQASLIAALQQNYYDFSLRAVKYLLVMAGEFKRLDVKNSEDVVFIKAMKKYNLFPSMPIEETVN